MSKTYKEFKESLAQINDFNTDADKTPSRMNFDLKPAKKNPDDYFDQLIDHIESKNIPSSTTGTYKECWKSTKFAILKSTNPMAVQYPKKFLARQKGTDKLRALGVQTPRLAFYSTKTNSDSSAFYEIQERAEGSTLSFFGLPHFEKFFKSVCPENYDSSDPYLEDKLHIERAKYNTHMQKLVLTAPMEQKTDFMNQYKTMKSLRIGADCHEENILYSKNSGFWFIDIEDIADITDLDTFEIGRKLSNSYLDDRFLSLMFHNSLVFGSDSGPYSKVAKLYNNLIVNQLLNPENHNNLNYDSQKLKEVKSEIIPKNDLDEQYNTCLSDETVKQVYDALKNENYDSLEEIDFDFRSDGNFLEIVDKDFFISTYENLNNPENMKIEPENFYDSESDIIKFDDESTM